MYKTLRRGEGLLQYRVVGSSAKRRRRRRHRLACLLVISTAVGAVTVAAAVIVPVVLTANLVALPARLQTLAMSTKNGLTRYIAVLPVREAKFKLLQKHVANSTDWQSTHIIWKELSERRLWLPVLAAFCLAMGGFMVVLAVRKCKDIRDANYKLLGNESRDEALLAEASEEEEA